MYPTRWTHLGVSYVWNKQPIDWRIHTGASFIHISLFSENGSLLKEMERWESWIGIRKRIDRGRIYVKRELGSLKVRFIYLNFLCGNDYVSQSLAYNTILVESWSLDSILSSSSSTILEMNLCYVIRLFFYSNNKHRLYSEFCAMTSCVIFQLYWGTLNLSLSKV